MVTAGLRGVAAISMMDSMPAGTVAPGVGVRVVRFAMSDLHPSDPRLDGIEPGTAVGGAR